MVGDERFVKHLCFEDAQARVGSVEDVVNALGRLVGGICQEPRGGTGIAPEFLQFPDRCALRRGVEVARENLERVILRRDDFMDGFHLLDAVGLGSDFEVGVVEDDDGAVRADGDVGFHHRARFETLAGREGMDDDFLEGVPGQDSIAVSATLEIQGFAEGGIQASQFAQPFGQINVAGAFRAVVHFLKRDDVGALRLDERGCARDVAFVVQPGAIADVVSEDAEGDGIGRGVNRGGSQEPTGDKTGCCFHEVHAGAQSSDFWRESNGVDLPGRKRQKGFMRTALAIVVALLVGLALGTWSVKSDLRAAREEISELKSAATSHTSRQSSLRTVTSALHIPEPPKEPARPVPHHPPVSVTVSNAIGDSVETTNAVPSESMQDGIKTAADLWKTRSALARDSFLANIEATPVQQQMFDQAAEKMNKQLGERIKQWSDYLKQQKDMSAETGIRMVNNLSEPVIGAYDDLDRSLAPGWRDKAGTKFQMFDFINPEVALPLAEVEGKLNHAGE